MTDCPQCGFDYSAASPKETADAILVAAEALRSGLLGTPGEALRARPAKAVWSGLEYTCHVRDVLIIQRERLYLALVEKEPVFVRMYRDERAALARYNEQDPEEVAVELRSAARMAALAFSRLSAARLRRRFVYGWPEPQERDVAWLGSHTLHEVSHHLRDFEQVVQGKVPA